MEKTQSLLKSLAAFQYECPIIHKDTSGYNYTYADLPKIISTIMPLLQKHNLCFSQPIMGTQLRTIIYHTETGESLESITDIPVIDLSKMNRYQSFGSGITYYRRYALSSILGIVTDKDNDASGEQVKDEIGEEKRLYLITLLENSTYEERQKVQLAFKIEAITSLDDYGKALLSLQANQIEDKDRIAMGLNFNAGDIKKTLKNLS